MDNQGLAPMEGPANLSTPNSDQSKDFPTGRQSSKYLYRWIKK